jgi:hypothetical protein
MPPSHALAFIARATQQAMRIACPSARGADSRGLYLKDPSMKSLHSFRIHSLRMGAFAAALMWIIPTLHAADTPAPAGRFIGMNPAATQKVDRFIITYKTARPSAPIKISCCRA